MENMSNSDRQNHNSRLLIVVLSLVIVMFVGGVGVFFFFSKFNPYFHLDPRFQESQTILNTVRVRPLQPDEFARCLRLCESSHTPAQLFAITSAELAVSKTPEYKPQLAEVLTRVAGTSEPDAAKSATVVLKRLADLPEK